MHTRIALRRRRRRRGAVMIEALLVVLALLVLFGFCFEVSRRARAKLDSIYASRNLAFDRAMKGCTDGNKVSAGSIDDFSTPQDGSDPDAEKLMGSMREGAQVSAWGMDIAASSVDATVDVAPQSHSHPPVARTFSAQSWAGCVEPNHGANSPLAGSSDPTRIQNQIFALIPYTWNMIQPWLGVHF